MNFQNKQVNTFTNQPFGIDRQNNLNLAPTAASRIKRLVFGALLFILLTAGMTACRSKADKEQINATDTAGLAAFNAQKIADSLQNLNEDLNNGDIPDNQTTGQASYQDNGAGNNDQADYKDGDLKSVNDETGVTTDNATGSVSDNESYAGKAEPAPKKKKFSNASKDALIGAGSGAVLGAVISKKNRGLGAVIGAAVGGGAGYGIGKHKDNKEAQDTQ
ncbi:MAG TPA: YMGG-like glycine zipper-containing protein [Arachidicoccus sp.]|nr:YMGG-like glycine zipper-containing protein [Arachidicoccus sp.]